MIKWLIQKKSCNEGNKKLKFFINGKERDEFKNYVFDDLDKILANHGYKNEEEIQKQLESITDFLENH